MPSNTSGFYSFVLLIVLVSCTSVVPELHRNLRSDIASSDGLILIQSFETSRVKGSWMVGDYERRSLPGILPVELRMTARQNIMLQPQRIQLRKNTATAAALSPEQIWKGYRTESLSDYPFYFRMIPERAGFTLHESPRWIAEQNRLDTASPEQRQIRYRNKASEVQRYFTPTLIPAGETRIITLLFRLPVPDAGNAYTLVDESGLLPSLPFYFESVEERKENREMSIKIEDFLKERNRTIKRDLHDLYDEHAQIHAHEELAEKQRSPD